MLVYFCSTGYKEIEVLNGNERGSSVDSITKFNPKEIKLKHQVFLDNATGDVYEFSQVLYNIGIATMDSSVQRRAPLKEVC